MSRALFNTAIRNPESSADWYNSTVVILANRLQIISLSIPRAAVSLELVSIKSDERERSLSLQYTGQRIRDTVKFVGSQPGPAAPCIITKVLNIC